MDIQVEPWGAVESLLSAACGDWPRLTDLVMEIGLDATADVIVEELRLHCDAALDQSVDVQFELECRGESVGRVLTISPTGLHARPGWAAAALAKIRFDAVELIRALFGPSEAKRLAAGEIIWSKSFRDAPAGGLDSRAAVEAWNRRWIPTMSALNALLSPLLAGEGFLGDLSVRFGSDKWAGLHWYAQHYESHFKRFRYEPVRLLEIGIGGYQYPDLGGASLFMWQRYFPRGLIYGLDLFEKSGLFGPRIRAIQGDQSDAQFLDELGRRLGPFDIIIDDGSHVNDHVRTSFHALFPYLSSNGVYVIEDLETSYLPHMGGDDKNLDNPTTSMGLLKTLTDELNHEEFSRDRQREPEFSGKVIGIHLYHNLAFVEKGLNVEGSVVELGHGITLG